MAGRVEYVREEVARCLKRWQMIDDCLAGEDAVKARGDVYLPRPLASDKSASNVARYDAYLQRAVYYNASGRTLAGLVGQVFAAEPAVTVPPVMDPMKPDLDGTGLDLEGVAKRAVRQTLAKGRGGFLVDFPAVEEGGAISQRDILDGAAKPTVTWYRAQDIINWRTRKQGVEIILELVVLAETYVKQDDGFKEEIGRQWRVLRLDSAGYVIEIYREENPNEIVEVFEPKDYAGKRLQRIPFQFVGSEDNTPDVDPAPMYDLCALNIAHYRNSADYEDSCYITGQPTPWASGLTQNWVDDVLGGTINLGSRAFLPLPVNAQCGLLQPAENTMPFEAMQHKERQMVALGAKLVEQREVERTAREASMEKAAETNSLATVVKNVSAAMTQAMRWAAAYFYGIRPDTLEDEETGVWVILSTDFAINRLTPEERQQLMAEWQGGAITSSEYRDQLRAGGVATLDDESWKSELETSPPPLQVEPIAEEDEPSVEGE